MLDSKSVKRLVEDSDRICPYLIHDLAAHCSSKTWYPSKKLLDDVVPILRILNQTGKMKPYEEVNGMRAIDYFNEIPPERLAMLGDALTSLVQMGLIDLSDEELWGKFKQMDAVSSNLERMHI